MTEKFREYIDGFFADETPWDGMEQAKAGLFAFCRESYRTKIFEGMSARSAFEAVCDEVDARGCQILRTRKAEVSQAEAAPDSVGAGPGKTTPEADAQTAEPTVTYVAAPEHNIYAAALSVLGVLFYFASVIPLLILENAAGALFLFPMAGFATGLLLYVRTGFPSAVYRPDGEGKRVRMIPSETCRQEKLRQKRGILFSVGMAVVIASVDFPIAGGLVAPRQEIIFIVAMFFSMVVGVFLCLLASCFGHSMGHLHERMRADESMGSVWQMFSYPVYAVIFGVTLTVYLIVSILTMKWWITWLLWVAAYCVIQAVHAIRGDD